MGELLVRNIPFSPPDITEDDINEVVDTLRSGWITTGPKTKLFESKISEYCGTRKAVCLNSATAGMELILRVLGIEKGDEVITSAYTYTASASVIDHVGARVVLVDVAPNSYQMDLSKLEEAINENTKAIISVDLAGVICDYSSIINLVESKKNMFKPSNEIQDKLGRIAVIADGAHSFGASQGNRMSGNIADFTSFSFHAVKNLTTAEGGAVTWREIEGVDSDDIYRHLMTISLHGQTKDALAKTKLGAWEYDIISPAYKCNMTDIMASLGLSQLRRYNEMLEKRKELINRYDELLAEYDVSILKHYDEGFESSGHLYIVRLNGKDEEFRNDVIVKMAEAGIAANVHYKPLPMMTAYKNLGFGIENYPNAFDMYRNGITLPLNTLMSNEDIEYVVKCFKEFLKGSK